MYLPSITASLDRVVKSTTRHIDPIVKPVVDPDVLEWIDAATLNDAFVYVHCYFTNNYSDALVRIWQTTFLVDESSGARSGLLHAENITIAPLWTAIPDNHVHNFLLVFGGLPKSCRRFDLIEEIPQAGGFVVRNIPRNDQDVYHVDV